MVKDISGQRFGKLVAIKPTAERIDSKVVWECKCDCGNTVFVHSGNLNRGKTTSCGCAWKEYIAKELVKDLTGQRFGRLTVIKAEEERKNGQVVWECKCDCGNTVSVRGGHLRNGHTISCGCLTKECMPKKKANDLTGQRFGMLVALRPTGERKNGFVMWECKCDCGNTVVTRGSSLKNGNTTSCGCSKKLSRYCNENRGV